MTELRLNVLIDPTLTSAPDDAVLYDGDIRRFFHDMVAGKPLPLTLALREVRDVDALLAVAVFLHRDLAIHPGLPGLLAVFAMACEEPFWGLAHVDRDIGRFVGHLRGYLGQSGAGKQEQAERVATAVGWIRELLLEGRLPQMAPAPVAPTVITVGTNGFVFAEGPQPHRAARPALA